MNPHIHATSLTSFLISGYDLNHFGSAYASHDTTYTSIPNESDQVATPSIDLYDATSRRMLAAALPDNQLS